MQKYKPYKKSFDYSYTIGIFPTLELLSAKPEIVETVLVQPNSGESTGIQKIRELCAKQNIPCIDDAKTILRLSGKDSCFAIGVFNKFDAELTAGRAHVVLVNPDDAGNLGTIMRTMLAFEHNDLAIIRPAVDIFSPKVIRASMGAIFKLRVKYFDSIDEYRGNFAHNLYPFILRANNVLGSVDFKHPYSLIFGPEGAGLPASYAQMGTPVRIEQSAGVDSLNLGVVVGLGVYRGYVCGMQGK